MRFTSEIIIALGFLASVTLALVSFREHKKKPESVEQPRGWIQLIPYVFFALLLFLYILSFAWGVGVITVPEPLESVYRTVGLLLYGIGVAFSLWAARSMGKMLRPEVMIQREHQLIVNGPFTYVRHPVYFGGLLTWFGIGIALSNILILFISLLVVIPVYAYRAKREEELLMKHFGEEFRRYQGRAPMLFPKVTRSRKEIL